MSDELNLRGGRFKPLTTDGLTAAQRTVLDELLRGQRGSVDGPFNVFLRSPELGNLLQRVGEHVRFRNSLPPNLKELAILLTAQWWQSQFEWFAHRPLALAAGLRLDVIDAIHGGERPATMTTEEATVYDFSTELRESRRVTDATFTTAVALFGEQGVMDLIATLGYYDVVSMALNVDRYPLPAGEVLPFPEPAP